MELPELSDDVIYCIILVISLPIAHVVKLCNSSFSKKALCTVMGVSIVCITCGRHILHSIVTTLVSCILIKLGGPRKCHTYLFFWGFGYLLFFRTCHYLGFPQAPALSNAVQLLLTLRMVGIGFEIHDTHTSSKREDCSSEEMALVKKYQEVDPSFIDIFLYAFCFLGQFTGPYYKFRTYQDMIKNDRSADIPTFDAFVARMKAVPILIIIFVGFSYFFSLHYVTTDEFLEHSFLFRLFYMVPMFTIFRARMYIAWLVSECMSMASTLGAYPVQCKAKCGKGPTDLAALEEVVKSKDIKEIKYDFETIHNLDIYGCDLAPRVRDGLRSWNMTVQYWLASCVHHRVPKSLAPFKVAITMAVSAFWHGVHPGYYLSFGLVPIFVAAEDRMVRVYRKEGDAGKTFDWVNWFLKMRAFDYMCMGFLLLRFDYTLAYWRSIYFIGHIMGIIFIVIGRLKPLPKGEKKKE